MLYYRPEEEPRVGDPVLVVHVDVHAERPRAQLEVGTLSGYNTPTTVEYYAREVCLPEASMSTPDVVVEGARDSVYRFFVPLLDIELVADVVERYKPGLDVLSADRSRDRAGSMTPPVDALATNIQNAWDAVRDAIMAFNARPDHSKACLDAAAQHLELATAIIAGHL
ncbi:MAG: hypothetical protein Q7S96_01565 [bacterium]|nr:hypothetical protein [bacterium]